MRKSRADTAATRKHIIATASRMFLEDGLVATNIADIMSAAGLTQGGFYRHFESKEQLIAEANQLAFDELLDMFDGVVAEMAPAEAIKTIARLYLRQSLGKERVYMCPIANLGSELGRSDAQIQAVGAAGYKRLVRLIADKAQELKVDASEKVANAVVSTMVGAVTLSQLVHEASDVDAVLSNAQGAIELLLRPAR